MLLAPFPGMKDSHGSRLGAQSPTWVLQELTPDGAWSSEGHPEGLEAPDPSNRSLLLLPDLHSSRKIISRETLCFMAAAAGGPGLNHQL